MGPASSGPSWSRSAGRRPAAERPSAGTGEAAGDTRVFTSTPNKTKDTQIEKDRTPSDALLLRLYLKKSSSNGSAVTEKMSTESDLGSLMVFAWTLKPTEKAFCFSKVS